MTEQPQPTSRPWMAWLWIERSTVALPLFLLSATFYPVSSYDGWGWLVQLSPLYHGVALVRALNVGQLEWAMLGHVAVLVALTMVGLSVASRRVSALLLT